MKKILISTILTAFFAFSVSAGTNIGVSISAANMDATGTHTTNSSSGGSGGTAVNRTGSADFEMASFFVEKEVDAGGLTLAIGLDMIPMTAEVEKLTDGRGFDSTIEVGNLMTAYIQPMYEAGAATFFLKAGFASAALDITDVSRQATNTSAGTASTDGAQSKSLEGMMYGAGLQTDARGGFIRLEATVTDFDEISHTNSNGKVLKADSELTRVSLSFGKSF